MGSMVLGIGAEVEVRLFGRFTVRNVADARTILLPHKAEELLAYLLLSPPGEHLRARVADDLWSASHGDVGKQLRQTLWMLRSALRQTRAGRALLRTESGWISCVETPLVWVDHRDFRKLVDLTRKETRSGQERLRLHRAMGIESMGRPTLLEGWSGGWIAAARAWVAARRLEALHTIVATCQANAGHEQVVHYTEEALRIDPSCEFFHHERIRAYGDLGDRGGAWRAYQECLDGLRLKGLDPAPETLALVQRAVGITNRNDRSGGDDHIEPPQC